MNIREQFENEKCSKCQRDEKDRCNENELVKCNGYSKYLEQLVKQLLEATISFQELNVCYRLGKRPSEKLFSKLEEANKLISSITGQSEEGK